MAEGVGFEPTVPFPVRRFSRPLHSSTLPPFRAFYLKELLNLSMSVKNDE